MSQEAEQEINEEGQDTIIFLNKTKTAQGQPDYEEEWQEWMGQFDSLRQVCRDLVLERMGMVRSRMEHSPVIYFLLVGVDVNSTHLFEVQCRR